MSPIPANKSYEKVRTDEFVEGIIQDIKFDPEHQFKSSFGDSVGPAVQFKFIIKGCAFPKKSKFLKYVYSKKSNLYKKYMISLIENPKEYMAYDIDRVIGLKVKMLWKDEDPDGKFQGIDVIRPADGKKLPFIEGELTPEEKQALIDNLPIAPATPLEDLPF